VLSGEGLVATKNKTGAQLVTGGSPMTEGRHYWEVELTAGGDFAMLVGATRPGLEHDKCHWETNDAYYIGGWHGGLCETGEFADTQGRFVKGDRIGVLLDLDAGWMQFYRNGQRCRQGFTEGVTGPLVRAAQLYFEGNKVTALPAAVAPEGAGGVTEPWEAEVDY
jgi:hypothetical protein